MVSVFVVLLIVASNLWVLFLLVLLYVNLQTYDKEVQRMLNRERFEVES